MSSVFIISVFIIVVVIGLLLIIAGKAKNITHNTQKTKTRAVLMREATKRLAQNSRDPVGLNIMGNVYYQEQDWEKAYSSYSMMMDNMKNLPLPEQFTAVLRCGISAIKTGRVIEAKKVLKYALSIEPRNFDVNYNLAYAFYMDKDYERAAQLFKKALVVQPDNYFAVKYMGCALQKMHKYNDAITYFKKTLNIKPDDKEVVFAMGECFYETGASDKCVKMLTHLRADPSFGPQSCLYIGMIKAKENSLDKAAENFMIGLKHKSIPFNTANDLRYRLAQTLLKNKEIGQALKILKELHVTNPGYKDVSSLISRYQELNQNRNLQIYLMSGQSDFAGLCRKIVAGFYPNAKVKILDISVLSNYTDIVAEIDAPKYSDIAVFRFFRSQGVVGELLLRDFHGKVRETKGGRGVCMTAGTFAEEAVKYAEGRPIDLYDKRKLSSLLNSVN